MFFFEFFQIYVLSVLGLNTLQTRLIPLIENEGEGNVGVALAALFVHNPRKLALHRKTLFGVGLVRFVLRVPVAPLLGNQIHHVLRLEVARDDEEGSTRLILVVEVRQQIVASHRNKRVDRAAEGEGERGSVVEVVERLLRNCAATGSARHVVEGVDLEAFFLLEVLLVEVGVLDDLRKNRDGFELVVRRHA